HRILRPARSDEYLALRDPRRHRQRVLLLWIRDARFPHRLAGRGIEGYKAAVDDRRDDFAFIERHAAADDAAADFQLKGRPIHFGIPFPQLLASSRIDRVNLAPCRDAVEHAVRYQEPRFLAPPT